MQFLVDILLLGFADPDPESQNLADPTDPDPKHCFNYLLTCIIRKMLFKNYNLNKKSSSYYADVITYHRIFLEIISGFLIILNCGKNDLSSEPLLKDGNFRFTTEPFKLCLIKYDGRWSKCVYPPKFLSHFYCRKTYKN